MFGRRKKERELEPPPVARENSEAVEVLRVWAQPDSHHQVSLKTTWREPGAWGLLLVDLARHAARAYEREGMDASEALAQIRQLFDAEWTSPTDEPEDLTDNR